MVIWPSWLASPASHAVTGALPKAMFTIVRISSTVTVPSSLQSPTQGLGVNVGRVARVGRRLCLSKIPSASSGFAPLVAVVQAA
jgi:hypothetical protein